MRHPRLAGSGKCRHSYVVQRKVLPVTVLVLVLHVILIIAVSGFFITLLIPMLLFRAGSTILGTLRQKF